MSRPSAKLCVECLTRPSQVPRTAPLRGVVSNGRRNFTTKRGDVSPVVERRCRHSLGARGGSFAGGVSSLRGARGLATANEPVTTKAAGTEKKAYIPPQDGPLKEYDSRVEGGRLRDDPYQRGRRPSHGVFWRIRADMNADIIL